jgi:hypothetical protein
MIRFQSHKILRLDIVEKIIPLFQYYPIQGVKAKDFEDFCKVAELIRQKKTFNG